MESAWEKVAQGIFSLGSYRDANNQLRPVMKLQKWSVCSLLSRKRHRLDRLLRDTKRLDVLPHGLLCVKNSQKFCTFGFFCIFVPK